MPNLYVMRHGKAENTSPDIGRHLSSAGKEDVRRVAAILNDKNIKVDRVIYSSAERAKQTAMIMCDVLNISPENQLDDTRIYNASVSELREVLSDIDNNLESVLIVGHNPGFADLVFTLCEEPVHLSAGNIAVIQGDSWEDIRNGNGKFIEKI